MNSGGDGISPRQLGALALTAAGLPIFRLCCRINWLWVLLGGLAAAGTLSALTAAINSQRAHREGSCPRSGKSLPIARTKAFPLRAELSGGQRDFIPNCAARPRKWVPLHRWHRASPASPMTDEVAYDQRTGSRIAPASVLFATLLLLAALLTAWQTTYSFPETAENLLAAALVLVLSAAAACGGPAAVGRCASILLWVTGALYGTVLVFSLRSLRNEWLVPAGEPVDVLRTWAVLLLPGAALCLVPSLPTEQRLPHWPWWAASGLAVGAAAVTGGILSPALARDPEAFRTLARGVSVLGVIRRFEALVNGALLMSGFALCTLYCSAAKTLLMSLENLLKKHEKKFEKSQKKC